MSEKTYEWLVDRKQADQEQAESLVEINQEALTLKLERQAFGDYAAIDMSFIKVNEPFTLVPTDTSHGESGRAISFQIALSGSASGTLPGLGDFVLDSEWGMITDYSEGQGTFIIAPGEPVRSLGGTLSVERIQELFQDEAESDELQSLTVNQGVMKSFQVTPAMRNLIATTLSIPLIGPLRKLYLEGTVLQIFSLIFQNALDEPVIADSADRRDNEIRKALEQACTLLTRDLANPPSLLQLSQATGLGVRKLSREFNQAHDMTLVEYLADQRLQAARDLIQDQPDVSIKALAHDVGYKHVSNFTSAFKRKFGITPAAFAKTVDASITGAD